MRIHVIIKILNNNDELEVIESEWRVTQKALGRNKSPGANRISGIALHYGVLYKLNE